MSTQGSCTTHSTHTYTGAPTGPAKVIAWVFQVVIAAGFLYTGAYFKFTSSPISIALFEKLGAEPAGRYAVATMELLVAILLLIPRTAALGALLGMGVVSGALLSHTFWLGFGTLDVPGQEPASMAQLAIFAAVLFVLCAVVVFLRRAQLPIVGKRLAAA